MMSTLPTTHVCPKSDDSCRSTVLVYLSAFCFLLSAFCFLLSASDWSALNYPYQYNILGILTMMQQLCHWYQSGYSTVYTQVHAYLSTVICDGTLHIRIL
eukprot:COSAG02_NODE_1877_length_10559_cov_8.819025_11_plen_100_part_00